jgi:DNA-binding transcriptional MerR regulator
MATGGPGDGRRGGAKAPDAFRTIREVSEELDVPQHVLRFWESKFTQIKPLKRGGGRRYYRPDDIVLLRRIRALLYVEGYTIKGVQKLLREGGAKALDAGAGDVAPVAPAPAAEPAAPPAPATASAASSSGLSDEQRKEMAGLVDELTELRDMLRGRI